MPDDLLGQALATFVEASSATRIAVAVVCALIAHFVGLGLRAVGRGVARARGRLTPKVESIIGLAISAAVFVIYFAAIGFVLTELGVPLTAYLASASVIGLAVAFGSQSVVQDVVTGMTLIFANLLAVGDMVSIGGQSGRVEAVGIRFTTLRNPQGALIRIPNRSVVNVVAYPAGYLRCLVDVQLRGDADQRARIVSAVDEIIEAVRRQFAGINVRAPSSEGRFGDPAGREFYRVKLRLWPDRGDIIDRYLREELIHRLQQIDAGYAPWMVASAFEIGDRDADITRL